MIWNPFAKNRRQDGERRPSDPEASSGKIPVVAAAPAGSVNVAAAELPVVTASGSVVAEAPRPSETSEAQASQPPRPVEVIREEVIEVLRSVYDPEIPVNVYELGLVYEIDVTPPGDVRIRMTLTSPACPVAGSLPPEVEHKVGSVRGVTSAKVELVWDPPWSPSKMSEAARLKLNV